jgi:hypothetical protein
MENGAFLQLPQHNFGTYAGLTLSFWFKPVDESGSNAKILDFSRGADTEGISVGRKDATEDLVFAVRTIAQQAPVTCEAQGHWKAGMWKHVAWSLNPVSDTEATWKVYMDGSLVATQAAVFPPDAVLTLNYLGKSSSNSDGSFAGYLDSFFIYQMAVADSQVAALYWVRWRRVCACAYVHVFIHQHIDAEHENT